DARTPLAALGGLDPRPAGGTGANRRRSVLPRWRDPPGTARRRHRGPDRRRAHRPPPDGEWRGPPRGPSGGEGLRLIRELLAELEPHAYAAGLPPPGVCAAASHRVSV